MNDPHVVALQYLIEYDTEIINWSQAEPLYKEEEHFWLRVKNGNVRFEFKKHYASEMEARSEVEDSYIPNWELTVGLTRGPKSFTLRFDRSEIVDRNPPPGPPPLSVRARAGYPTVSANLAPPTPPAFPEPPSTDFKRTPDVESMYQHYLRYLGGGETLPAMAYFCLTMLEKMAGNRDKAAVHFRISKRVLDRIGELSSNKGGTSARKAAGQALPFTSDEERFLRSAIKAVILRAAEVEYGRDPNRSKITLADL